MDKCKDDESSIKLKREENQERLKKIAEILSENEEKFPKLIAEME